MSFQDFFQRATETTDEPKGRSPYPFQERFADAPDLPRLLRAPTGSGKTATAVLGWLWRLKTRPKDTPRRLVYCLPMRVLVEQSAKEAEKWIDALCGNNVIDQKINVHVLMGGVDTDEWFLYPERPAILIGTQDMLLSRALNRGYAASRFHWPIDFGLLNNDCLWVFDEPQLMGSGVSTSAQLAGLRQKLGTFGNCPSVWMSATLEPGWLDTVDFKGKFQSKPLELDEKDFDPQLPLHKRMTASKTLSPLDAQSSKDMKAVAKKVWEIHKHKPGTQTLVVLNTVDRAKATYDALLKERKKSETPKLLLIHSRFRPQERKLLNELLQQKNPGDRIIVATQVVEAGVDISSRTLITELAPWASIVQRIGRCNRTGDDGAGQVFWISLDTEKQAAPYESRDLVKAEDYLKLLDGKDVSPKSLADFRQDGKPVELPFEHKHVLRRRDLLDLFDTAPDLSGNDIDIQRFVRGDVQDTDVQVFWRDTDADGWNDAPERNELCNAPVGSVSDFLKKIGEKKLHGLVWDHLDEVWQELDWRQARPGQVILLPTTAGGYSSDLGWDPDSKSTVIPVTLTSKEKEEATGSDPNSESEVARSIIEHTANVCCELDELLIRLESVLPGWNEQLSQAACWHDVGKALLVCQQAMHNSTTPDPARQLAKSGRKGKLDYRKFGRRYFRHELGSALAVLQEKLPFAIAYLVGAHHGKVRLTIRALPNEDEPKQPDTPFALGVHHGDVLPSVDLGNGAAWKEDKLDLSPMKLGGDASWTANALRLLAELGPFKLAYLETLLRAADVRASRKEAGRE